MCRRRSADLEVGFHLMTSLVLKLELHDEEVGMAYDP
jgi:hypothetical protein